MPIRKKEEKKPLLKSNSHTDYMSTSQTDMDKIDKNRISTRWDGMNQYFKENSNADDKNAINHQEQDSLVKNIDSSSSSTESIIVSNVINGEITDARKNVNLDDKHGINHQDENLLYSNSDADDNSLLLNQLLEMAEKIKNDFKEDVIKNKKLSNLEKNKILKQAREIMEPLNKIIETNNQDWSDNIDRYGGKTLKRIDSRGNWEYITEIKDNFDNLKVKINENFIKINNIRYWAKTFHFLNGKVILELLNLDNNKQLQQKYKIYQNEQTYYNALTSLDLNSFVEIKNEINFFKKNWKSIFSSISHLAATGILMNKWMNYENLWVFNLTSLSMRLWGVFGGFTNSLLPETYAVTKVALTFLNILAATGGETVSFNCANWAQNQTLEDCLKNPFPTTLENAKIDDYANIFFNHITYLFTLEGIIGLNLFLKRVYDLLKNNGNSNIFNNSLFIALKSSLVIIPFNILTIYDVIYKGISSNNSWKEILCKTIGIQCATVGAYIGLGSSISSIQNSKKTEKELLLEHADKEAKIMNYEKLTKKYDINEKEFHVALDNQPWLNTNDITASEFSTNTRICHSSLNV